LSPLGIDVIIDKPGLGRNLQDHLQQRAIYKVANVRTLNETYWSLFRPRPDGARLRLPPSRTA
jgi:choline dehydrogenase-like flavoprotein